MARAEVSRGSRREMAEWIAPAGSEVDVVQTRRAYEASAASDGMATVTNGDPRLWLIRHGETEWSRAGRHTGRTDVPLTATGEEQASALRGRIGDRRFALVLSSPLRRAWETCRLAGLADGARTTDDLLEWNYGAYEGRTTPEIRKDVPGWTIWTGGVPAGETVEDVGVRARRIIDEAARARGDVALFAHGHVLRVLAACWLGLPPREGRLLALGTAALGVLGYENATRVVRAWNLGSSDGDLPR